MLLIELLLVLLLLFFFFLDVLHPMSVSQTCVAMHVLNMCRARTLELTERLQNGENKEKKFHLNIYLQVLGLPTIRNFCCCNLCFKNSCS